MILTILQFVPLAYLLWGCWCAWMVDNHQMSKPVPYGDMPAIAPLPVIRAIVIFEMVIIGPVFFVQGLWTAFHRKVSGGDTGITVK